MASDEEIRRELEKMQARSNSILNQVSSSILSCRYNQFTNTQLLSFDQSFAQIVISFIEGFFLPFFFIAIKHFGYKIVQIPLMIDFVVFFSFIDIEHDYQH